MTLVRLEIFKLSRKLRTYLGFGALVGLAGLIVLAVALSDDAGFGVAMPSHLGMFGSIKNGGFVAWLLLKITSIFLLPLFACVIVGDMISGEAADGTLRSMLSRPISRAGLLSSKFVVSWMYVTALTFFMGIAAYLIGFFALGHGALVVFDEGSSAGGPGLGIYVYQELEGLLRLAGAYAFAVASIMVVASIAFFISIFISNSLGAIGGAMMVYVVFTILGTIPYFKPIQPYLFTSHMSTMNAILIKDIPWEQVGKSLAVLFVYIIVLFRLGLTIFKQKDVLS